jgi:alginate O-acetyltransferase complex protein AlgI
MEIISLKFAAFAIVSFLIFYLLNHRFRIGYLVILSCGFIASFSYYLLIYILFYSLINYFIGKRISDSKFKIALFRTGVILNLSQLILLRYASFAIDPFFHLINTNIHFSKLSTVIIPIGISYFTLQGIGYLINVKMGWEIPEKKFLHFLLYLTFFPKFLSGPIERSNHFLPQLKVDQAFNEQQVSEGLRIALIGFFKKIVIANQLAPFISSAYANVDSTNGTSLWMIIILQPLYLYFDFSGYTEIAIGFAKTFGIQLLPNFNKPFFSQNMTTFWKRFHISLSSWFNDYVFKQTSFKRRKWGVYASVYGLLVTWILFGIWHGAGWNFMLLGLVQALAIIYEFFSKKWRVNLFSKIPNYLGICIGRIFTYLFYGLSLVFFFSPDIKTTLTYFSKLTTMDGAIQFGPLSTIPISLLISIPVFLTLELIQNDFGDRFNKLEIFWTSEIKWKKLFRWSIYCLSITLMLVVGNKVYQFIYVNF